MAHKACSMLDKLNLFINYNSFIFIPIDHAIFIRVHVVVQINKLFICRASEQGFHPDETPLAIPE